jgi:hypothetical protein
LPELLSLLNDHFDVVVPGDFAVTTARMVFLAWNHFFPVLRNDVPRFPDCTLDRLSELVDDILPNYFDVFIYVLDDFLAAHGTFIASLKECTVLFFSFGPGSLVDHSAVLFDGRITGFSNPSLNFRLDLVKVLEIIAELGLDLAHVAVFLVDDTLGIRLLNSISEANQRNDKV